MEDGITGRRRWPWLLALAILLFLAGMAAGAYTIARQPRVQSLLHLVPQETAAAQIAAARQIVVKPVPVPAPAVTAPDPAIAGKIAELSDKVDDIEGQARAATGDASRAEGLLVAFAARRALDRGIQLGYIEGLLRQRFGHGQPEAVATILSASRLPVTLADLQNGLDGVAPQLAAEGAETSEGWWTALRRELAGLVVIRRADQPSTQPADRVARAERMLEAGQVDGALAEVLRLSNHAAAKGWVVSARRYLAGRGALDRIETAALLDPAIVPQPSAWPAENATPASVPTTNAVD